MCIRDSFEAGDPDGFLELAKSLYLRLQENGDENLWARIALLGQKMLPGERLFDQTLSAPAGRPVEEVEVVDELAQRRVTG